MNGLTTTQEQPLKARLGLKTQGSERHFYTHTSQAKKILVEATSIK